MNTASLISPENEVGTAAPALVLTEDQKAALAAFYQFLCKANEPVFVLKGYSGCGKTTLVTHMITETIPKFLKMAKLIGTKLPNYEVEITATTNKAAENISRITGWGARTVHSFLGLRIQPVDIKKKLFKLVPKNMERLQNVLLFVDEASFIDKELLELIFKLLDPRNCKVVFIGDPAQLAPVNSSGTPVFDANFLGAELKEVVRQANASLNPIVDLSTQFRHTVNTGEWPKFKPDGHHVQYLSGDEFKAEILKEFGRPDWRYHDSKILGWTNAFVIDANGFVRNHVKGSPHIEVGDYAVCNSYVQLGKANIKTDQLVAVTGIEPSERFGVPGTLYTVDGLQAFMPVSLEAKAQRIREAKAKDEISVLYEIDQSWIDLRPAYAQTINKAQGSTYGKVFIDLDDVSRCHNGDQIARMLYVGVSRARDHVYLTGDIA
jgi:hypothetical protein